MRSARRTLLAAVPASPAVYWPPRVAPATQAPTPARTAIGKVVVMSYQTTSPRLDCQIAMYEEVNRSSSPRAWRWSSSHHAADTA